MIAATTLEAKVVEAFISLATTLMTAPLRALPRQPAVFE